MENNILDEKEQEASKLTLRGRHLIIESILVLLIILGRQLSNSSSLLFIAIGLIGLLIFHLVSPGIRYRKGNIPGRETLLRYLQTLVIFLLLVIGLFKLESWLFPYSGVLFFMAIIILWLFLALWPQFELRKRKAPTKVHLLLAMIGLGILLAFLGSYFKLESYPYASELMIIGGLLNMINLILVGVLLLTSWNKYRYITYYLPRLSFAFYLGLGILFYEFLHLFSQ